MNDISSIFQGCMLEARSQAIGEIRKRRSILEATKTLATRVAASALSIKSADEIPDRVQDLLDPMNKEIETLNKLEGIISYEIYNLANRADEIIASHEDTTNV